MVSFGKLRYDAIVFHFAGDLIVSLPMRAQNPRTARQLTQARAYIQHKFHPPYQNLLSHYSLSFASRVFILRPGIISARCLLIALYFFFSLAMFMWNFAREGIF